MKLRKTTAALFAVGALATGSAAVATAAPTPAPAPATGAALQQQVDSVIAGHPQGRQVSADKIEYDGFTATKTDSKVKLDCSYGHLCMKVRGTVFDFYKCQTWKVHNWYGTGPYVNNQTKGTVARFYGKNGKQIWTSTAYDSGKRDWAPVWSLKPC
ncbi:hypothetical protein AB0I10_24320 [Streptomyces sp. NPDC050636]|uniref:hypothetical protein n=1 Tax=Streptomyces sp. NPDC050636 TaxID=3154510 RepID=UPI003445DACE